MPLRTLANLAAVTGIVLAVITLRQSASEQRKAGHYQAWQAITLSQGNPGSGGRIEALQDLNVDGVSLRGVILTGDSTGGAFLRDIQLPMADLQGANLRGADLFHANLLKAKLDRANLRGATLWSACLQGANLFEANLQSAHLMNANLRGASLQYANLQRAFFKGADLRGAILSDTDLSNTESLTRNQVLSARDWRGAVLPDDLKDLELPPEAAEEQQDSLGRSWSLDDGVMGLTRRGITVTGWTIYTDSLGRPDTVTHRGRILTHEY